ncbi:MAG: hypothetical protein LBO79_01120 [Zoogloeaceae bacterium]|jgi:hypothetical protein|nr:hypothetical protein [Zoogloeaceae bacterium]
MEPLRTKTLPIDQWSARIRAFWGRFSIAERHQLAGACCALIAIFYGSLFWYPGNKQLGDLLYKEEKLNKRKKADRVGAPTIKLENLNIQETQQDLARAQEALARQEAELERLTARFMPLDDLESLQVLKSEIARLAESGDMEVVAIEHVDQRDNRRPPSLEALKQASQASPYKRPLLSLRARASYRGLMQFLDGLGNLTFIAAPVWSNIQVRMDRRRRQDAQGELNATPRQWLEVEIRLAI